MLVLVTPSLVELGGHRFILPRFTDNRIIGWVIGSNSEVLYEGIHEITPWSQERIIEYWKKPETGVCIVEIIACMIYFPSVEIDGFPGLYTYPEVDGDPVPQIGDDELAAWDEFLEETKKRSSRIVER